MHHGGHVALFVNHDDASGVVGPCVLVDWWGSFFIGFSFTKPGDELGNRGSLLDGHRLSLFFYVRPCRGRRRCVNGFGPCGGVADGRIKIDGGNCRLDDGRCERIASNVRAQHLTDATDLYHLVQAIGILRVVGVVL